VTPASDNALSRRIEVCAEAVIAFQDCDPMGVLWHGRYAEYFELARVALMEELDYGYAQMADSGYTWPVIDYRVRYLKPLCFGRRVIVKTWIVEWQFRLKLAYLISDANSGEALTRGHTVQAAVRQNTGELQMATPPILRQRLGL